jgi:hypothetical protein
MVRRALLIAFHFPPARGSSGLLRTVKFAEFLPRHGWQCDVLTATPNAYPARSAAASALPTNASVTRSFALDAARHLGVAGRYPRCFGWPDRWGSWCLTAIPRGLALIRRQRPQVLWATFPIASAVLIGLELARRTGLPLVCDLRDPMSEPEFPEDPRVRRIYRRLEQRAVAGARRVIFTAPGALEMYRQRYPEVPARHWQVIGNGYDEEDFEIAGKRTPPVERAAGRTELLHSGLIYPVERDPRPLLAAIAELKKTGAVAGGSLRVTLRASGHDAELRPMINAAGVADIVCLAPPLPYHEALAEMMRADGLLLLQAANCNQQIPAKLYEYLRAQRPILALTDARGDTAAQLVALDGGMVADLASVDSIRAALAGFLQSLRGGGAPHVADLAAVRAHSRQQQAGALARLFDEIGGAA